MLHFLRSLSLWDWLDVVGVLLVLAGVVGEIAVRRMKFKTPAPRKSEDADEDSPMVAGWVSEKEAWQSNMNKWEHRWENALIIGLALELIALPFHIREAGELNERAAAAEKVAGAANERAAKLEKEAAELRKANTELWSKMQWRLVRPEQKNAMVSFLSHPAIPKLPVELTGSEQDMEAMVFLRHISRMLIASGFPVTTNTWLVGGGGLVGTSFSWHHDPSPNHVGFILKVFTNAGFDHPLLLTNNNVMENTLRIQIGTKPMMGNLDLPPEQ